MKNFAYHLLAIATIAIWGVTFVNTKVLLHERGPRRACGAGPEKDMKESLDVRVMRGCLRKLRVSGEVSGNLGVPVPDADKDRHGLHHHEDQGDGRHECLPETEASVHQGAEQPERQPAEQGGDVASQK